MKLREESRDVFSVPEEYYLAHCVSSDFALGAGIAVQFVSRFGTRDVLRSQFPWYERYWTERASSNKDGVFGDCLMAGRVLNLVTKRSYWNKPTYASMRMALEAMKRIALKKGVKRIAMPRIGCGLDRLDWPQVRSLIQDVFGDTDIEILVCEKYPRTNSRDGGR